ncbi:MAG: hypothetical protein ISR76_02545 [Planctomycetes bacterium]|nr:hypothetical protein [Planctomycetota bacterium]
MNRTRPGQLRVFGPRVRFLPAAILVTAFLSPLAAQEPDPGAAGGGPSTDLPSAGSVWDLRGRIDANFRYRKQERLAETDTDALVTGYLDGSLRDADGAETFRFLFDGVLTADLDGLEDPSEAFYGLGDTRNSRTHGFVYAAWAETSALADDLKLRVGRQEIHREDALYFDGARLDAAFSGPLTGVLYAGSPVRFYESDRTGDYLGGVGLRWAASQKLHLGLDEIVFRDRAPAGDRDQVINNNLTLLTAHWAYDTRTMVRGSSSWIGNEERRQQLSVLWSFPEGGWWTRVHLQHQSDYGEVVVTDLSPFAAVVGDVAPYWSGSAELHKELSSNTDLGVGYSGRWLDDAEDEGVYDREYGRWFALLSLDQFPIEELRTGLRGDLWDSDGARIVAGGLFFAWVPDEESHYEVGTDFSKYRFDTYTGREYLDDRQYYFRLRHRIGDQTSLRFRLARDRSQFGTDTLIEAAVALEF